MPHISFISFDLADRDLSQVEDELLAPARSRLFQMPTLGSVNELVSLLRAATTTPSYFRPGDDADVIVAWRWAGSAAIVGTFEGYRLRSVSLVDMGKGKCEADHDLRLLGASIDQLERIATTPRPMAASFHLKACRPITEILPLIAFVPAAWEFLNPPL